MSIIDYKNPTAKFTKPLELGGGDKPHFHPNIDVRAMNGVDTVFDFDTLDGTTKLPIEDGAHDLVFCQYAIEHISWRRVDFFIREIFRVLAKDGAAQVITANTFEQCKTIAARGMWEENDSCMLFGDQNYGENSHKSGWSIDFLSAKFKAAGFDRVYGSVHPQCKTDLIITAEKGNAHLMEQPK